MNNSLEKEYLLREYLLGRLSDEVKLAEIEELLFTDEDFCTLAEFVEDDLINDYVFARLNANDRSDFDKTLENLRSRREKVAVTVALKKRLESAAEPSAAKTSLSFLDSLRLFFQKPANAGAFAVVLIGVVVLSFFLLRRPAMNELSDLRAVYQKERPTESRISDFEYAPLITTRGEAEEREAGRLRRIEITLLEAVEKQPSAKTQHELGIFYLTQRKYPLAIASLEKALTFNEKDAAVLNDLGSSYFEKAKAEEAETRLASFSNALENFSKACSLAPDSLAALFNKSLSLQELRLYGQARESWKLYLEKDARSGWADEARRNLERLEQLQISSKTKEQVVEDFLLAYRKRDAETAWRINSQTREMVSGVWLADQLSRRFLEVKIRGDDAAATESIDALRFIGNLEREKNADFFVGELAEYYSRTNPEQIKELQQAKELLTEGYRVSTDGNNESARAIFLKVSDMFARAENRWEHQIAEHWIAFSDSFLKNLEDSNSRFFAIKKLSDEKKYRWLHAVVLYRLSTNFYFQNKHSESLKYDIASEKIMNEIVDSIGQGFVASDTAASYYEIGELEKALVYSGKTVFADNSYYQSVKQTWRNQSDASKILARSSFPNSALQFALEQARTARGIKDKEYVFNSLRNVAGAFASLQDFDRALEVTNESLQIASGFSDTRSREISIAKSSLLLAEIKRLAGNCEQALANYGDVLKAYDDFKEEKVDEYKIRKGKLLCYQQLKQTENMSSELEIVRGLLEKYRSEILEEEKRNVFFDNEQSVSDIAVAFHLASRDPSKAFEIAEEAKARSLLDSINGAVSVEKNDIRFSSVSKNLDLAEIQNRMPSSTQLVQYAVLADRVAIWVIANGRFEYSDTLVGSEALDLKVRNYLRAVTSEKENPERWKALSSDIFELLVAPILSKLDTSKQICFVPDKSLYRLPFAALFSKAKNKYLVEDLAILYAPSSTIFVLASENAQGKEAFHPESLLSIGNPKFDSTEYPNLSNLSSAETEVKEIAGFYPVNRQFIGETATKSNVLSNLEEQNILHFAGHYVASDASSENSKLLLAKPEGDLLLSEISEIRLRKTKLVVLSACQTSIERLYRGEGSIGIARTFLAVGSPSVLASGWMVDTESTKDLMIAFHRNRRKEGLTGPYALRAAQIEMLKGENTRYQTPYFWSAFSLVGAATNY